VNTVDIVKSIKPIKPPTTHQQQIELLRNYGFDIDENDTSIMDCLRYINYYRMKGYYLHWLRDDHIIGNVPFKKLIRIIEFDSKLKQSLLSLILTVEVAFKSHVAYELAHVYGPVGYHDSNNFMDAGRHARFLEEVSNSIDNSYEIFVRHYKAKYGSISPIWVAIEVIPFGALSMLYKNMKEVNKKNIAKEYYDIDYSFIESWLECLSIIRNICAHNSRLYNRGLPKNFKIFNDDVMAIKRSCGGFILYPNTVFAALLSLKYLIKDTVWYEFVVNLMILIEEYKDVVELKRLGMPFSWDQYIEAPTTCGINCRINK